MCIIYSGAYNRQCTLRWKYSSLTIQCEPNYQQLISITRAESCSKQTKDKVITFRRPLPKENSRRRGDPLLNTLHNKIEKFYRFRYENRWCYQDYRPCPCRFIQTQYHMILRKLWQDNDKRYGRWKAQTIIQMENFTLPEPSYINMQRVIVRFSGQRSLCFGDRFIEWHIPKPVFVIVEVAFDNVRREETRSDYHVWGLTDLWTGI
jgi:hypothetical protein